MKAVLDHVGIAVDRLDEALAFYRDALGLDVTRRRHGATFMSSGRYHHHIAGNVWHSAGAGRRDDDRAGLAWLALEAADAAAFDGVGARLREAGTPLAAIAAGVETADPWGTRLRITRPSGPLASVAVQKSASFLRRVRHADF
jgi:catechol 2,3-dioxygenase